MSPEPEKGPNFRYQQLVAPIALYPDALVPRYSPPPPTPEEIAGARGLASRRAPPRPFLGRNDGAAAARPCRATHKGCEAFGEPRVQNAPVVGEPGIRADPSARVPTRRRDHGTAARTRAVGAADAAGRGTTVERHGDVTGAIRRSGMPE